MNCAKFFLILNALLSLIMPRESAMTCTGSHYGAVVEDVLPVVYKEGDKVKAVFQSACPRNNVRLEGTFLTVERQVDDSADDSAGWEVVSAKLQLVTLFHICWDQCGRRKDA